MQDKLYYHALNRGHAKQGQVRGFRTVQMGAQLTCNGYK